MLSEAASWVGQGAWDEAGLASGTPNGFEDIQIGLTGLQATPIDHLIVQYNTGAGTTIPYALERQGLSSTASLLVEPLPNAAYPINDPGHFFSIEIVYANAPGTPVTVYQRVMGPVVPSTPMPGSGPAVACLGQGTGQDWVGPGPSVGPDEVTDIDLQLSGLPAGASLGDFRVTANQGGTSLAWQTGLNPQGYANAVYVPGTTAGTGDLYINPVVVTPSGTATLVNGTTLNVTVTFNDPSRQGESITSQVAVANVSNPPVHLAVTVPGPLAFAQAHWDQQASGPADPSGDVSITLDALPQGVAPRDVTVTGAVLSDVAGDTWQWGNPPNPQPNYPLPMTYQGGVFSFPPERNELGSPLMLTIDYTRNDDPSHVVRTAVAQVAGQASDPNLRGATATGAGTVTVTTAAGLVAALGDPTVGVITIAARTTIDLTDPVTIARPVTIQGGGPNAVLEFTPGPSQTWTNQDAVNILASHVTLNGFTIDVASAPGTWVWPNTTDPSAVLVGVGVRGTSITGMNLLAQALSPGTAREPIDLIFTDSDSGGTIANNPMLRGGSIEVRGGPWSVTGNSIGGPFPGMESPTTFDLRYTHDVTIEGNHVFLADTTNSMTAIDRLVTLNNSGFNDLIEGNTFDGGAGQRNPGNNAEVILSEAYTTTFEGTPAAVSTDGWILEIPYIEGEPAAAGDVVSILSGPSGWVGRYFLIAQQLSPTTYLMAEPLPPSDGQAPNEVIAIDRGYVGLTVQDNTINLADRVGQGDVGIDLAGAQFGTQVLCNTVIGDDFLQVGSSVTNGSGSVNPLPYGWSHLPVLGLDVAGNTFSGVSGAAPAPTPILLTVEHGPADKSNSGRLYLKGLFTDNELTWAGSTQPAVIFGSPGYSPATIPWVDDGELNMTVADNWGRGPSGQVPVVTVVAATINGVAESKTQPTWATAPAPIPQDGRPVLPS